MRGRRSDNSVVLRYGDGEYTHPVIDSTVGDKGFDIGKLRAQTGLVTLDSGYGNTAALANPPSRIWTARRASSGTAASLIEQLAERSSFVEVALPADQRRAADRRRSSPRSRTRSRSTPCRTRTSRTSTRAFLRDAHPMAMLSSAGLGAVDVLPGQPQPVGRAPAQPFHDPAARQASDDRGLRVQEVDQPPVRLPAQRPRLRRELPRMTFSVPAQEDELSDPTAVGRPGQAADPASRTTSRTARPPQPAWSAPRRRTCSPRSPPASTRSGACCTAAPTSRCWRCWRAPATRAATSTPSSAR